MLVTSSARLSASEVGWRSRLAKSVGEVGCPLAELTDMSVGEVVRLPVGEV
jgi:hypothetical protein